jgi:hypothetical protein
MMGLLPLIKVLISSKFYLRVKSDLGFDAVPFVNDGQR